MEDKLDTIIYHCEDGEKVLINSEHPDFDELLKEACVWNPLTYKYDCNSFY